MKKTFLELQGLGLLVSQLSDYSACFMCCIRLLFILWDMWRKKRACLEDLFIPTLHLHAVVQKCITLQEVFILKRNY